MIRITTAEGPAPHSIKLIIEGELDRSSLPILVLTFVKFLQKGIREYDLQISGVLIIEGGN